MVGARPNFMKAAPVYRELVELHSDVELSLVHAEHYDAEMSVVFLDELELRQPDVLLGVSRRFDDAMPEEANRRPQAPTPRDPLWDGRPANANPASSPRFSADRLMPPATRAEGGLPGGLSASS